MPTSAPDTLRNAVVPLPPTAQDHVALAHVETARRKVKVQKYLQDPPGGFLHGAIVTEVTSADWTAAAESCDALFSAYHLQDIVDYRAALQGWFAAVRRGGHLIVIVPHAFLYERQLELPTALNPGQRRLYTPGVLTAEIEEALEPNSYRVRLLQDDDRGLDYAQPMAIGQEGNTDLLIVLEKIDPPAWGLDVIHTGIKAAAPNFSFEPVRTRVEVGEMPPLEKVIVLKLDHMGDFIMGLPALEKARRTFRDAELTLVVGAWNEQIARGTGIADKILVFDAFPTNSTEQEVDVHARKSLFETLLRDRYDLALDLRTDLDTRFLLRSIDAKLRAGVGTRAQFPFLDIFLPLDFNRNEPETAAEYQFNNHDFVSQGPVMRHDHRSVSLAETVERDWAILWGPYRRLRPGRYFFEPWIELLSNQSGALLMDVALDTERVAQVVVPSTSRVRIPFAVERNDALFEFRIFTIEGAPALDFSFFGGRLVRAGAASVLHQAEYLQLLIELVRIRLRHSGQLADLNLDDVI